VLPTPPALPASLALRPLVPDGVPALVEDPHDVPRPPDGATPADALAVEHDDAAGVPPAPLPFALFAAEFSETVDGWPPHAVPRLAFVGTPGAASAVVHVDAFVGSCAEPTRRSDAPAAPVARDRILARRRESDIETSLWLVSPLAVGPLD
jgi:hypothetical protein